MSSTDRASEPGGLEQLVVLAGYLWRPDGSWGARVAGKALWFCIALMALVGVVDLLLPDL